ncbi:MAG: hypothetical protein HFF29_04990 [Oscillospiraceae bacterium]|nr:hypothetical protein [Oscillospiraceae bacterium]
MQHTKKYRFNLIEKEDVFSPDALNENMEKVEGALEKETAARTKADADLDRRLQTIEAHKIVFGSAGNESATVDLGFTPLLLYVTNGNGGHLLIHKDYHPYSGLYIVEGGFHHVGAYASCGYVAFI